MSTRTVGAVRRSARSELVKLRRRGHWAAAVVGPLLAAAAFSAITVATAGDAVAPGPGGGTRLVDLAAAGGGLLGVEGAATLLGLVALAAAATSAAQEHSTGVLRNLLVRQPARAALVAGKALVLAAVAAAVGAAASLVGLGVSALAASARGLDVGAWSSAEGWQALASTAGDMALSSAGFAVIGVAVGLLLRSPAAAVGVAAAWLLPFETLLAGTVEQLGRWLPGRVLVDVAAGGGGGAVSYAVALAVATAYAATALAAAIAATTRRDVTS